MKRLLMVLALAGFAVACGDDDEGTKSDSGLPDGGKTDGGTPGIDGGGDAGRDGGGDGGVDGGNAKVLKAGIACETSNIATTCGGSAPICSTKLFSAANAPAVPGNYCTAACTTVAGECGDGTCVLGQFIGVSTELQAQFGTAAYCHQPCATVGSPTGCRQGFVCQSVKALADARDAGSALLDMQTFARTGFCFPIPGYVPPDAGPSDAGPTDAGPIDAGPTDAGVVDANVADAGDAS